VPEPIRRLGSKDFTRVLDLSPGEVLPLLDQARLLKSDYTPWRDTFRSKVQGIIYGATLVSITPVSEDTYETTLSLDKSVVKELRQAYITQMANRPR